MEKLNWIKKMKLEDIAILLFETTTYLMTLKRLYENNHIEDLKNEFDRLEDIITACMELLKDEDLNCLLMPKLDIQA